ATSRGGALRVKMEEGREACAPRPRVPPGSVAPAAAPAAAAVAPAGALLLRRARRPVLPPLDQLPGPDAPPRPLPGDQLQADPAAGLVALLDDDVDDVAAGHHVLDVSDAARADVRHVQQPVGALLQLDERAELRGLDDLAGERVAHLRLLRHALDRLD